MLETEVSAMPLPVDLSDARCLELLRDGVIGRVALCSPLGPRIVPLTYALRGDSVVWRTSPYSELALHGRDQELAFEVDHIDYERRQAWSVVAVGRCEAVDDPETAEQLGLASMPAPWAGGHRPLCMRLRWRSLTGRLVSTDQEATTRVDGSGAPARW
jgi:hypothetical protein